MFLRSRKKGSNNWLLADSRGFVYWRKSKEIEKTGRTYWMCSETRKRGCPCRVTTVDNMIVSRTRDHNHDPIPTYVDAVNDILNK